MKLVKTILYWTATVVILLVGLAATGYTLLVIYYCFTLPLARD